MIPLANDDRAAFGLPGTDADRWQPQRSAIDEPAARVVVDQQLAHRLLRPVRGLRHQLGSCGTTSGSSPP